MKNYKKENFMQIVPRFNTLKSKEVNVLQHNEIVYAVIYCKEDHKREVEVHSTHQEVIDLVKELSIWELIEDDDGKEIQVPVFMILVKFQAKKTDKEIISIEIKDNNQQTQVFKFEVKVI
jgi:SH3-like domain-containing protein